VIPKERTPEDPGVQVINVATAAYRVLIDMADGSSGPDWIGLPVKHARTEN